MFSSNELDDVGISTSPSTKEKFLTEKEVATQLSVTTRCLQAWRYRGGGPKYIRISARCVRYRPEDVRAWIEERTFNNTSEVGQRGVV